MWLEPDQVAATFTYLGQTHSFCCEECRELFAHAPEAHIARLAHEPKNSAGHRCPYQRPEIDGPVAGSEYEAPRE
jgi:YHS domain-containing protein